MTRAGAPHGAASRPPPAAGGRRGREVALASVSVAAALAMTWPLAREFTTRFCGGIGDPQLTTWSMRWLRDALVAFENPFFTSRLYHPFGTTLVFHTFDLPSALLVVPLWGWVPEPAIYNTAIVAAFALTVYGMARLARELTGDAVAGLLAGLLFAGVPYHYAHLRGHLHLVSMGWVPLYVLHLVRVLEGRGGARDAVLAGLFLALASLASWYHLLFAAVITAPVVVGVLWHRRGRGDMRRLAGAAVLLCGVWAVLAGPLFVAMAVALRHEPILGAHDAMVFSADASSFFDHAALGLATDGEHATYVGYVLIALALFGALSDRHARGFLVAAVAAGVLTLGPVLRWRGETLGWRMPYGYLERLVPGLAFSGTPVRFGYVVYFGLVVAAAFGLARVRMLVAPLWFATVLAVAVTGAAIAEYGLGPVVTSECPVPPPMRAWADDERPWAVLDVDVSGGCGQMWRATLHRKPIVGGYLGRVSQRLEDWILRQPVLAAIVAPDGDVPLERIEPRIDRSPPDELVGDRFSAEWTGHVIAPSTGLYAFRVTPSVDAAVDIDDETVIRHFTTLAEGRADPDGGVGRKRLAAGVHTLDVRIFDVASRSRVSLEWAPPGDAFGVVPAEALRTSAATPGLDATYQQHVPALSGRGRVAARQALRELAIRYVVTADVDNRCVLEELALPLTYRGEGMRIYEVPARDD